MQLWIEQRLGSVCLVNVHPPLDYRPSLSGGTQPWTLCVEQGKFHLLWPLGSQPAGFYLVITSAFVMS